jgi:predicted AlkP superfamily pyrophosphatase or phosphodiesterase
MRPIALLVIDGLRRDSAERFLTTPFQLVAEGRGGYLPMTSLMPTKSRPSYNTISTGVPSPQNGIAANDDVRMVTMPSIWTIARSHGLTTAASAYSWWSELYNGVPFRKEQDAFTTNSEGGIQHGFFSPRDSEPDAVVLAYALQLWKRHHPDLMLIHPCSVDYAGDYWGAKSLAYDETIKLLNLLLEPLFTDLWRERPEAIILVTSDHGMAASGGHGWDAPELRQVFFFALASHPGQSPELRAPVEEATALDIAPTILHLLDLPIPLQMTGRQLV